MSLRFINKKFKKITIIFDKLKIKSTYGSADVYKFHHIPKQILNHAIMNILCVCNSIIKKYVFFVYRNNILIPKFIPVVSEFLPICTKNVFIFTTIFTKDKSIFLRKCHDKVTWTPVIQPNVLFLLCYLYNCIELYHQFLDLNQRHSTTRQMDLRQNLCKSIYRNICT